MESQSSSESSQNIREHLEALELQNELYRRAQVVLAADCEESISVFENAPVGFFVLDLNGAIHRVNRRGAESLGIAAHRLFKQNFQRFVCEQSTELFASHLALADGPRHSAANDLLLRRENGDLFWARMRSEICQTAEHRSPGIILTIDEIDDLMLDI